MPSPHDYGIDPEHVFGGTPDDEPAEDECDVPIGSCEICGVNLYPEDNIDVCPRCEWEIEHDYGEDR